MRKTLLLAAAALLAGCSSDDSVLKPQQGGKTPVSFGTYIGQSAKTRAGQQGTIDDATKLQELGFGVFAYYTAAADYASATKPNFMYNQKVSGAEWTYSPLKYWPNDNSTADNDGATGSTDSKISFFAYAPFVGDEATGALAGGETSGITAIPASATAGDPSISYALAAGDKSVDLLWGTCADDAAYASADGTTTFAGGKASADALAKTNINVSKLRTGEKIKFNFKHALAKIGGGNTSTDPDNPNGLQVVLDVDNGTSITGGELAETTKLTIESIEITNDLDGDGTLTGTGENAIKGAGTLNLATGAWSGLEDAAVIIATKVGKEGAEGVTATIADNLLDPGNAAEAFAKTGVTTKRQNVYKADGNPFLLIPGTTPSLRVKLTYYITTKDNHLDGGYSRTRSEISKTVSFPSAVELNKAYSLVMHIGVTGVKFTAEVEDWEDATGAGEGVRADLPLNVE